MCEAEGPGSNFVPGQLHSDAEAEFGSCWGQAPAFSPSLQADGPSMSLTSPELGAAAPFHKPHPPGHGSWLLGWMGRCHEVTLKGTFQGHHVPSQGAAATIPLQKVGGSGWGGPCFLAPSSETTPPPSTANCRQAQAAGPRRSPCLLQPVSAASILSMPAPGGGGGLCPHPTSHGGT